MLIPLNLPVGDRQREFLDYLNSALRSRLKRASGSAGRRSDVRFESMISGEFDLGTFTVPLIWRIVRNDQGIVETLEAIGGDGAPPQSEWQTAAFEFITSVLSATIAARRST